MEYLSPTAQLTTPLAAVGPLWADGSSASSGVLSACIAGFGYPLLMQRLVSETIHCVINGEKGKNNGKNNAHLLRAASFNGDHLFGKAQDRVGQTAYQSNAKSLTSALVDLTQIKEPIKQNVKIKSLFFEY